MYPSFYCQLLPPPKTEICDSEDSPCSIDLQPPNNNSVSDIIKFGLMVSNQEWMDSSCNQPSLYNTHTHTLTHTHTMYAQAHAHTHAHIHIKWLAWTFYKLVLWDSESKILQNLARMITDGNHSRQYLNIQTWHSFNTITKQAWQSHHEAQIMNIFNKHTKKKVSHTRHMKKQKR